MNFLRPRDNWVVGPRRLPLFLIVTAVCAMACAIEIPPPGGPVDVTPPQVMGTTPRPDSAGFPPDSPLRIEFSEKMTRTGIGRLLSFEPAAQIMREGWKGNVFIVEVEGGFHPDTTYVVTLRNGYKDNHGVSATGEYRFAFATATEIDSGSISGRIMFRREATGRAIVRCFALPTDSGFVPEASRPQRETRTDESGTFTLDYLPTDGNRFVVWAFENKGDDNQFDVGKDIGEAFLDTIVLSRILPRAEGIDIWIVDPGEPGKISGRVINETGIDTMVTSVALFAASDSLRPSYYLECQDDGVYEFSSVNAGTYALHTFVDLGADSVCGVYPCGPDSTLVCPEPCSVSPDSLVLAPGDEIRVPTFRIGPVKE